jgi:phosphate transport system substrate-binding protein
MKMRLPMLCCVALLLVTPFARAQVPDSLPFYEPGTQVSGTIRIWGNEAMHAVVKRWQEGFRKRQPGAVLAPTLIGSDVAVAGLYTGSADIALLGRDPTASEVQAFEWIFRYRPLRVEVMNGSVGTPGKSPALVVFVHKDNPLAKLTLAQLDAIFGHEHRRGLENVRTWGQLGLEGDWAGRPINLYARDATSGTGRYFRQAVLGDSRNMNWERLEEFSDRKMPGGSVVDADRQILDRLAQDRIGMAVSHLRYARPEVKALALSAAAGGPYVEATAENLAARRYPLARTAVVLVNRAPGAAIDPKVREFLGYVLSRDGQAEVAREGDYLPLESSVVREQAGKLD